MAGRQGWVGVRLAWLVEEEEENGGEGWSEDRRIRMRERGESESCTKGEERVSSGEMEVRVEGESLKKGRKEKSFKCKKGRERRVKA